MANNLLQGKRGVISGALDENSIAWKIAERCVEEGATIVLTNAPVAMRMGEINHLAEKTNAQIIPADATDMDDLENLFGKSVEILGGPLDFVLHSIGMSINVRKKKDYTDLNYEWMQKSFDISAISFHRMMQTLYKLDAMNEWGSILGLSYIAAQRSFPDYSEMAESKALLESFARSFGYHFGTQKKVRVGVVLRRGDARRIQARPDPGDAAARSSTGTTPSPRSPERVAVVDAPHGTRPHLAARAVAHRSRPRRGAGGSEEAMHSDDSPASRSYGGPIEGRKV